MIRPFLQAARCATRITARRTPFSLQRPLATSSVLRPQHLVLTLRLPARRSYSSGGSISKEEVEGRILDLLKGFDKVKDASKLTASSNFANDLGLDSLDTVEVVMAIEEEFSIEIPDKEADAILSVDQAVEYILHQPDAH